MIFSLHSSSISLRLLRSSEAFIPKALVTLYQNLGVLVTCLPAMGLCAAPLLALLHWPCLD